MTLEPATQVLLSKWIYDANVEKAAGALDEIVEYITGSSAIEEEEAEGDLVPLVVNSAVYRNKPHVYQEEDGSWTGHMFDLRDILVEKAKADGFDLRINIDTENGVVSDLEGYAGTPDGTLEVLSPECDADAGPCYDMILGKC